MENPLVKRAPAVLYVQLKVTLLEYDILVSSESELEIVTKISVYFSSNMQNVGNFEEDITSNRLHKLRIVSFCHC